MAIFFAILCLFWRYLTVALCSVFALVILLPNAGGNHKFGAIAYSISTRQFAAVWGHPTKEAAEADAIRRCNAKDAEVKVWAQDNWSCAIALGVDDNSCGWGWSRTAEDAKARALKACREFTPDCYIAVCISADGEIVESNDRPKSDAADLGPPVRSPSDVPDFPFPVPDKKAG